MSDNGKYYEVQGDTIYVDSEFNKTLNVLASRFYRLLGYISDPHLDFSTSTHPQERMMYQMALEAAYLQQQTGALDN
ncbi:hypothetical protein ACWU37_21305 (plasmid) [Photobacterium damselae subsp. damselae]